ncbi:hypothetical protein [Jannaschia seohaensis]|uniref:Uncharacterized protein n=1 Tax=Jannaschia seohaensis TaxID=475081 RepID=A0A2Y9AT87_9RHOB|nr:hypothetical protein [Jannaschia seohaensis]PWJ19083.1 hypothetical protein BCF38_10411 [Jannaschia seohaensis]SSA45697.1 hypothetical protein SAMN05421539_10411 [Jannaschia seohaensis]
MDRTYRVWDVVTNGTTVLVFGAVVALSWVNLDPQPYQMMVEYPIWFKVLIGYDPQRGQAAFAAPFFVGRSA